ncbi:NusG domain II-containing protein [Pseudothauera rhizosphaerae]|uniref:NusG domain II-containing protein n=1 Tax=Pseudothauera rhizosphaerae TaxID=2565932 RepID=A0A4V3WBZ0_9RHOO|nr:NusG domain II-containing protein [Pseudothauera rhizosphaerae]THF65082.1 NusG domain II-containing protein [Pseudothauera rhizosphaerae]
MKRKLADWLPLVKPGDWLVIAAGLALCGVAAATLWRGGAPDKAVVRAGGEVFGEYGLNAPLRVEVPGPLGTTLIEIEPGRARVAADPGPRQYCVRQGWLTQAGSVAICAPNQVSLSLTGRGGQYDSLNY